MTKKINIAVIGAGWWCTEFHLPYLSSLKNVNIMSVCRFGKKELNFVKNKYKIEHASENFKEALSYQELAHFISSIPILAFDLVVEWDIVCQLSLMKKQSLMVIEE